MDIEELRKKFPKKEKSLTDLCLLVKTRSENQSNFSLLLGSGASATSGVRSGQALVKGWCIDMYQEAHQEQLIPREKIDMNDVQKWLRSEHGDWYDKSNEYASFFEKKFDLPS